MKEQIMTVELNKPALCLVIEDALKATSNTATLSQPVTPESQMGSPREWDSLSFVAVFIAVGEAFDIELDDDDAIHFQAVPAMYQFLDEVMN
jgi:acyl carrier protein